MYLHLPEPTKNGLRDLRRQLSEQRVDQPLPPDLYRELQRLIFWAEWRIGRLLTRDQISYQRSYVVLTFIKQYIKQHGGKTSGSRKYAYHAAAAELTGGPYAGTWTTMKEDFLFEQRNAVGTDRRSVRYREKLQQLAREKQARPRRR
jgi:hypothetical protein